MRKRRPLIAEWARQDGLAGGIHRLEGVVNDLLLAPRTAASEAVTSNAVLITDADWIALTNGSETGLHSHSGGAAHPNLATHDLLGLATDTELDAHAATIHGGITTGFGNPGAAASEGTLYWANDLNDLFINQDGAMDWRAPMRFRSYTSLGESPVTGNSF